MDSQGLRNLCSHESLAVIAPPSPDMGLFSSARLTMMAYIDEHPVRFSYLVASLFFVIVGLVFSHIYLTNHRGQDLANTENRSSLPVDGKESQANQQPRMNPETPEVLSAGTFIARITGRNARSMAKPESHAGQRPHCSR